MTEQRQNQDWQTLPDPAWAAHITALLDELTPEETAELLGGSMDLQVDELAARRIKAQVFKRAGFAPKRRFSHPRKLVVAAAAVALIIFSVAIIGVDKVAAAISGLFNFVPGYGIVEEGALQPGQQAPILYGAATLPEVENEQVRARLRTAIATNSSISLLCELELLNLSQESLDAQKEAEQQALAQARENGDLDEVMAAQAGHTRPRVTLDVAGVRYESSAFSASGGGLLNQIEATFEGLETAQVNTSTVYRLQITTADYEVELPFQLVSLGAFAELAEIGGTDCHNNISLTAVPTYGENQVTVDIYPLNQSHFTIDRYFKENEQGYLGQDLSLQTSQGQRDCQEPASYGMGHNQFTFPLEPGDQDLLLHIPYLQVISYQERQLVKLPLPQKGEVLELNQRVEFADATLLIKSAELQETPVGEQGEHQRELVLQLVAQSSTPKVVWKAAQFMRSNRWGSTEGGGYSYEVDQDGVMHTLYFMLEERETKQIYLQISNPQYYLTSEYKLRLEP